MYGTGSVAIGTKLFEPLATVPPTVLEAVLLRLVGRIVADVAVMTVVGKGITGGFSAVCRVVPTDPVVAGFIVGVSVGVIEFDASVSAKTPPTDCEITPVRNAVAERGSVVVVFAPVTIAGVEATWEADWNNL